MTDESLLELIRGAKDMVLAHHQLNALVLLDAAIDILECPKACTHPNAAEVTAMGDKVRRFVCMDCGANFEKPLPKMVGVSDQVVGVEPLPPKEAR